MRRANLGEISGEKVGKMREKVRGNEWRRFRGSEGKQAVGK